MLLNTGEREAMTFRSVPDALNVIAPRPSDLH